MDKYEIREVVRKLESRNLTHIGQLDRLGLEGYELVAVLTDVEGERTYVLQRRIP